MMQKICSSCQKDFEMFEEDKKLYEKLEVPEPEKCFDCIQQHLMSFINHLNLYKRKCDATGENIISNFSPDKPYKVFKMQYWWSDTWDAINYGQEFDFNRPFFEQFQELSLKVPRPALFTAFQYDENSEYTNHAGKNKNCYMIFDADENRDCYYCYGINKCTDCTDLYRTRQSELCYECIDSTLCYNSKFLQNCAECRDSAFLENCRSCKSCFMCVNLQHKEYYFMNEYVGKEKYEELMETLKSRKKINEYKKQFAEFKVKFPKRYAQIYKSENSSGNYLHNTKNAHHCFDSSHLWDCRYVTKSFMDSVKDCMHCTEVGGGAELIYMTSTAGYNASRIKFSALLLDQISEIEYSIQCHFSANLFGCIGLRRKKYCILNKQYSPEEYKEMIKKIKDHMIRTEEYGKYFPYSIVPFGYNETIAQQWYPLTKNEALEKGWKWFEETNEEKGEPTEIPDNISDAKENICDDVIVCSECGKKYRIAKQEFSFYKKQDIAIPDQCFKCRHFARAKMRVPRKIFERKCDSCKKEISSGIPESSPEIVYCEECYLKKIY